MCRFSIFGNGGSVRFCILMRDQLLTGMFHSKLGLCARICSVKTGSQEQSSVGVCTPGVISALKQLLVSMYSNVQLNAVVPCTAMYKICADKKYSLFDEYGKMCWLRWG